MAILTFISKPFLGEQNLLLFAWISKSIAIILMFICLFKFHFSLCGFLGASSKIKCKWANAVLFSVCVLISRNSFPPVDLPCDHLWICLFSFWKEKNLLLSCSILPYLSTVPQQKLMSTHFAVEQSQINSFRKTI